MIAVGAPVTASSSRISMNGGRDHRGVLVGGWQGVSQRGGSR